MLENKAIHPFMYWAFTVCQAVAGCWGHDGERAGGSGPMELSGSGEGSLSGSEPPEQSWSPASLRGLLKAPELT